MAEISIRYARVQLTEDDAGQARTGRENPLHGGRSRRTGSRRRACRPCPSASARWRGAGPGRAMRRIAGLFGVLAALAAAPALADAAAELNAFRAGQGLAPLTQDSALDRAARAHAGDIAARGVLDHTGADGSGVMDRVRAAGYRACLAAENIGAGYGSVAQVFAGWAASAGHRRNMAHGQIRDFGFARDGEFWVLVLARPC